MMARIDGQLALGLPWRRSYSPMLLPLRLLADKLPLMLGGDMQAIKGPGWGLRRSSGRVSNAGAKWRISRPATVVTELRASKH